VAGRENITLEKVIPNKYGMSFLPKEGIQIMLRRREFAFSLSVFLYFSGE